MLGVFCGALVILAVVIVASPLGSLVSQRLAMARAIRVRTSLTAIAVKDAQSSPLIGYGDTRHMQGSPNLSRWERVLTAKNAATSAWAETVSYHCS